MRNKRVAARIQATLARQGQEHQTTQTPADRISKVQAIVERRMTGERNWTVKEIASREGLDYTTVYRALKGKPGWLLYGGTIRVTDSLYRCWLTASALGVSLDSYFAMAEAS